jgi:hypothetical protein
MARSSRSTTNTIDAIERGAAFLTYEADKLVDTITGGGRSR